MARTISLMTLREVTNEAGQTVLSGRLGKADVIGFHIGETESGGRVWAIGLAESDKAIEARKAYDKRRKNRDSKNGE